jgi:predicted RNase H-like HicB family nuclease
MWVSPNELLFTESTLLIALRAIRGRGCPGYDDKGRSERVAGEVSALKTLRYTVILEPETEPDGSGYNVRVPALPGCFTQGETIEEALAMARDAIALYLESVLAHGQPIPLERSRPQLELIELDVPA